MKRKRTAVPTVIIVIFILAVTFSACGKPPQTVDSSAVEQSVKSCADKLDLTVLSQDIPTDYTDVTPSELTEISSDGAYRFHGDYGKILITESNLKLHFIMDGATVSCDDGVAVDGSGVKNVTLTITCLTDANVIGSGGGNAVHIKGNLFINGDGGLTVSASKNCLKASKKIYLTDAALQLTAANHAVAGESVVAGNCSITVTSAGKDGINAECDGAEAYTMEQGYVALFNVAYDCSVNGDGVQADSWLYVDKGTYNITTTGEFVVNSAENKQKYGMEDDDFRYRKYGSTYEKTASDDNRGVKYGLTQSCKGFKVGEIKYEDDSGSEITVTDGDYVLMLSDGVFNLDCADDAIHANSGDVYVYGGTYRISTLDDGLTADRLTKITGGDITVSKSYEGIEGGYVEISGGAVAVVASDDGINAASDDGNVREHIIISGGQVTVDASGDGLDSNGDLLISGGTVTVYGPTGNGDGGLDADGTILVNGGTLVVTSSMGMAETPSKSSEQKVVSYAQRESIAADTVITVYDEANKSVMSFTTAKACQSVILSSPQFVNNAAYSLYAGDEMLATFKITSVITHIGLSSDNNRPGLGGPGGGMPPR